MDKARETKFYISKLKKLVELCEKTEPLGTDKNVLFSLYTVQANEMLKQVESNFDMMTSEERIYMMKKANKIWKVRKKMEGGELSTDWKVRMHLELEDNIRSGFKITAIKHYRSEVETHTGVQPSLRESKDYVDSLAQTMRIVT